MKLPLYLLLAAVALAAGDARAMRAGRRNKPEMTPPRNPRLSNDDPDLSRSRQIRSILSVLLTDRKLVYGKAECSTQYENQTSTPKGEDESSTVAVTSYTIPGNTNSAKCDLHGTYFDMSPPPNFVSEIYTNKFSSVK